MGPIGLPELLLILFLALLLFGGRRLPEIARGLGAGIRDFKRALHEDPPGASEAASRPPDARST